MFLGKSLLQNSQRQYNKASEAYWKKYNPALLNWRLQTIHTGQLDIQARTFTTLLTSQNHEHL